MKKIICLCIICAFVSVASAFALEGNTKKTFGFEFMFFNDNPLVVGHSPDSSAYELLNKTTKIYNINGKYMLPYSKMTLSKKLYSAMDGDNLTLNVTIDGKKQDITVEKKELFISDYIQVSDNIFVYRKIKTNNEIAYVWAKELKYKDFLSNTPKAAYSKTEKKVDCYNKKIGDLKQVYYNSKDEYLSEKTFSEYGAMSSIVPNTIGENIYHLACTEYRTKKYDREHPALLN